MQQAQGNRRRRGSVGWSGVTAMVRRRDGAARVLIGGRNLAGANDPAARFTLSIDGAPLEQWESAPGFFLKVFDIPAGRLAGTGFAALSVQSVPVSGSAPIPTAVEQFDVVVLIRRTADRAATGSAVHLTDDDVRGCKSGQS